MLTRPVATRSDLDECLSRLEQRDDSRPYDAQQLLQARLRGVAARQPENARWWAEALEQLNEVTVFGQHERIGFASGSEHDLIFRLVESESANRQCEMPNSDRSQAASRGESCASSQTTNESVATAVDLRG